jgi:exoribonuclease-2
MNLLFEEAGKLLAGRVVSETDASAQVELDSGRRIKVKSSAVLLRFGAPDAATLMRAAESQAEGIELEFVWDVAPDEEFGFDDLAADYFGSQASATERAALLLRLHGAPHYFARKGRGRFKRAPRAQVDAALAAIERRRQEQLRIEAMTAALVRGECPPPVGEALYRLLFKPDKASGEYKALVHACQQSGLGPLALLRRAGAIDDPLQFHMRRFFFEWFPKGTDFPPLPAPTVPDDLPCAAVAAFSIDDSSTTEIDDAFSLTWPEAPGAPLRLGIHIAAPGCAIAPDSALGLLARERMSTVYMPHDKFTMLPSAAVAGLSLDEGQTRPALSLYLDIDPASFEIRSETTRLERVPIAANLRHDRLDAVVTEAALQTAAHPHHAPYPFAAELAWLYQLAGKLKTERERVRGRPERYTRPDFTIRADAAGQVTITPRPRGAPLDLIVSELMILANTRWGAWLAECRLPGLYRSQSGFGAQQRTRMGTEPRPHAGLGVPQYVWATSPLRRYADLVNQWQLLACVRHGRTAALAAPFKPKDADLYALVGAFEAAYKGYAEHQSLMERYWTLRYIEQQQLREFEVEVLRDGMVRAVDLPLGFALAGAEGFARGSRLLVQWLAGDPITLDVQCRLLRPVDVAGDTKAETGADEDEDAEPLAQGLQTAVDLGDAEAAAPPATSS